MEGLDLGQTSNSLAWKNGRFKNDDDDDDDVCSWEFLDASRSFAMVSIPVLQNLQTECSACDSSWEFSDENMSSGSLARNTKRWSRTRWQPRLNGSSQNSSNIRHQERWVRWVQHMESMGGEFNTESLREVSSTHYSFKRGEFNTWSLWERWVQHIIVLRQVSSTHVVSERGEFNTRSLWERWVQ